MTRRHLRALAASAAAALPLTLLLAGPAAAQPRQGAGSGTTTVGLSSDAWYSTTPACTASPTGCLPAAAPNPYPSKTLHVGVAAGQEESRSYLTLGLGVLPPATTVSGGTLRVPVAPEADGSRAPESATLQACLVTAAVKDDVEGGAGVLPAIDCKRATAAAKYVAAVGTTPAAFVLDLAPFAAAWSAGSANNGIALLPAAGTAPSSAWHVAFSAHDRQVSALMRVTAVVSFTTASAATGSTGFDSGAPTDQPPVVPATSGFGSGSSTIAAPPLAPVAGTLPALAVPGAPAPQPQTAPLAAPALQPQGFAVPTSGYAYPGVFLLPLLIALAGGCLARALTRDLTPRT